jgi:hypothetical protein
MNWKKVLLTLVLATFASDALAGGFLYWSIRGGGGTGSIRRCDVSNCVPTTVVSNIDPAGIDIDPVDEEIYWIDISLGQLRKAPAAGGSPVLVFDPTPAIGIQIAVDPVSRKVYWRQNALERIVRANLDGTGLETAVLSNEAGCAPVCQPGGIEIDGGGGFIYWAESYPGTDEVRRRSTALGAIEAIVTSATAPGAIALDVANDRVFLQKDSPSALARGAISTPPNTAVVLAPVSTQRHDTLALDAADGLLYVALTASSKIQRCSTSDCDELSDLTDVVTGESVDSIAFLPVAATVPVASGPLRLGLLTALLLVAAWGLGRTTT